MADNNITKLIRALVEPVQDVENVLQQLYTERYVDTAVGDQLDILGALVGQLRLGLEDEPYRRVIRARISVNRSKGTIADVINVASLIIYDDDALILVDNHGPAALSVQIEGVTVDFQTSVSLATLLRETVSAGVRLYLETQNIPDEDAFTFDSFIPGSGPGQGFESFDGSTGGKLGNVV